MGHATELRARKRTTATSHGLTNCDRKLATSGTSEFC